MRAMKLFSMMTVVGLAWAGLSRSAWAVPRVDMLRDMQFTNAATTNIETQPIVVAEDGTNITSTTDLLLIIPATYSMTWVTSDTAAEMLMSGTGVVSSTVSYPTSVRCLVDVTTGFAAGDRLVISGISYDVGNSDETFDSLDISWDGGSTVASAANGWCTGGAFISSANNFSYNPTGSATTSGTLPAITITDASGGATITAASDIRITIPNNYTTDTIGGGTYAAPTFDTAVTTVTVSGAQSSKVSSTVTYANGNRTVIINVTSNFAASDTITVSGLRFAVGSGEICPVESLMLSVDGTFTTFSAVDDKCFAIGPPNIAYSTIMTVSASASNETVSTLTITDHAGTAAITAASDIRLIIMSNTSNALSGSDGRNNLSWDATASGTLSYGGTEAANVNTTPTSADPATNGGTNDRLMLLRVNTNFTAGGTLTVSGLKVDNATSTATKFYVGLCREGFTANSATGAYGRVVSIATDENDSTGSSSGSGSGGGGSGCFLRASERSAPQ